MSTSRISELLRYREDRLPAGTYVPLAIWLSTASLVSAWPVSAGALAINLVLAATLLLQFRLWDDLADLSRDRAQYPQRVLSQARSLSHFQYVLAVAFGFNLVTIAVLKPISFVILFLVLNGILLVVYHLGHGLRSRAVLTYHVVLLKYPVIVVLLRSQPISDVVPVVYTVTLVYLCFCIYEGLHDPRLRGSNTVSHLLAVEMTGLITVAMLMLVDRVAHEESNVIQPLLAIGGSGGLVLLYRRHRSRVTPGPWCYAVFLIGFAWLFNYALLTIPHGTNEQFVLDAGPEAQPFERVSTVPAISSATRPIVGKSQAGDWLTDPNRTDTRFILTGFIK